MSYQNVQPLTKTFEVFENLKGLSVINFEIKFRCN